MLRGEASEGKRRNAKIVSMEQATAGGEAALFGFIQAKHCSSWLASIRTAANFGKAWLSRQASQLFEAAGVP